MRINKEIVDLKSKDSSIDSSISSITTQNDQQTKSIKTNIHKINENLKLIQALQVQSRQLQIDIDQKQKEHD